jgi:tetratricopeptide (TPR) repeat protein
MQRRASAAAAIAAFQRSDLEHARGLAEEQLRTEQVPLLQHLIGLIDCRLGRFDSGVEWLRKALNAEPDNVAFRMVLARALIDSGRPTAALEVTSSPVGTGAAAVELWLVRAEAAFRTDRRDLEAEAWRSICAARPQDAQAWLNLARSLLVQERFDEAEAAYRRVVRISPGHAPAICELGLLLERTNRVEQLAELLDRAERAGIPKEQLAELWAVRALREGRADEAWRLAQGVDVRRDPYRLNALRAKIADAAGHHDQAFAAATAMNRSAPDYEAARERGRGYRDGLRALAEAIKSWRDLPTLLRAERPSPTFLVGFPRSGTTLVDTFLMGHPGAQVLEEVPLLDAAMASLGGISSLAAASTEQLQAARDTYFAQLDAHLGSPPAALVIDKQPLNMLSLPLIASLFPDARVLFAQRHPCDCVLSGFMQPFALNDPMSCFLDLVDAADFYDLSMRLFERMKVCAPIKVHTVVYERLVADPEAELRAAVDFLALDWRSELLDHRSTASRRGLIETPSYDQVAQPLTSRPSGRWKRYEQQLAPVLPVLLPWAERLGYPR